jgi:glutaminase
MLHRTRSNLVDVTATLPSSAIAARTHHRHRARAITITTINTATMHQQRQNTLSIYLQYCLFLFLVR